MNTNKKRDGKKGNVLVMVMAVMFILSILGMAKLTMARLDATEAIRLQKSEVAFSLAETGMNEFKAMVSDFDNKDTFQKLGLVPDNGMNVVFDHVEVMDTNGNPIGSYSVSLEHAAYSGGFFWVDNGYRVTATGRCPGEGARVAKITSYARTTTIAEQVWGSNSEGGVYFATGDYIWGSIRSNGKFYIDGTPFIDKLAKTHAAVTYYKVIGADSAWVDPDVFNGSLLYSQDQIDFNTEVITGIKDAAAATYPNNSIITFNGDSYTVKSGNQTRTYFISNLGGAGTEDNIIYVNGTVTVSGNVGGSVSVVAEDSILIDASGVNGGVVYSSSPAGNPDPNSWGDDRPDEDENLGLFAVNKVMVIRTADDTDINIHAAIYVPSETGGTSDQYLRGFCVQKYDKDHGRPDINFYGCIIQNRRGAVGRSDGTGFSKNYHQDFRFFKVPPPGTPITAPEFSEWEVKYLYEE